MRTALSVEPANVLTGKRLHSDDTTVSILAKAKLLPGAKLGGDAVWVESPSGQKTARSDGFEVETGGDCRAT